MNYWPGTDILNLPLLQDHLPYLNSAVILYHPQTGYLKYPGSKDLVAIFYLVG
jgi:hypothetical protein